MSGPKAQEQRYQRACIEAFDAEREAAAALSQLDRARVEVQLAAIEYSEWIAEQREKGIGP